MSRSERDSRQPTPARIAQPDRFATPVRRDRAAKSSGSVLEQKLGPTCRVLAVKLRKQLIHPGVFQAQQGLIGEKNLREHSEELRRAFRSVGVDSRVLAFLHARAKVGEGIA